MTQVSVDGSRARPTTPDNVGRRSKLNDETEKRILEAVELGASLDAAAAYADITPRTLQQWLERGRAEADRIDAGITAAQRIEQGLPTASRERPFAQLVRGVEKAAGMNETRVLSHVMEAVAGGWVKARRTDKDGNVVEQLAGPDGRLGLTLLERVHARRYGRRELVEVSGPDGGPVEVDLTAGQRIARNLGAFLEQVRAGQIPYDDPNVIEGEAVTVATGAADGPDPVERGGGVVVRRSREATEGREADRVDPGSPGGAP